MVRNIVVLSVVAVVVVGLVVGQVGCGAGSGASGEQAALGVVATGAQVTLAGQIAPADVATPPLLTVALPGGATVEINEANVGVEDVDLETADEAEGPELSEEDPEDLDDVEDEIDMEGPYIADVVNERLLNLDGTLALDIAAQFPAGTLFEEAELDIASFAEVCPDPARAASIHLHGTYRDSGGSVVYNFHLDSAVQKELEFDEDEGGGIVIDSSTLLRLIFAVDQWFSGVDLSTASTSVVDANGDVLFDDSNNAGLRNSIAQNILGALNFCEDDDGDGEPEDQF